MLFVRFLPIIGILAIAGSLVKKKSRHDGGHAFYDKCNVRIPADRCRSSGGSSEFSSLLFRWDLLQNSSAR